MLMNLAEQGTFQPSKKRATASPSFICHFHKQAKLALFYYISYRCGKERRGIWRIRYTRIRYCFRIICDLSPKIGFKRSLFCLRYCYAALMNSVISERNSVRLWFTFDPRWIGNWSKFFLEGATFVDLMLRCYELVIRRYYHWKTECIIFTGIISSDTVALFLLKILMYVVDVKLLFFRYYVNFRYRF